MLAAPNLSAPTELAAIVAPVAVYFLVLGLLNSRPHPQLLSGRLDFAVLTVALGPLFLLPLASWLGFSSLFVAAGAVILGGGALVLAPRGRTWVLYNVRQGEARSAVQHALRRMGVEARDVVDGFELTGAAPARLSVTGFAPLRNATLRLHGGDKDLARRFEGELAGVLRTYEVPTSPMAVSLLLVATAMLAAPLAVMAHRVPEIVRILTDLIR